MDGIHLITQNYFSHLTSMFWNTKCKWKIRSGHFDKKNSKVNTIFEIPKKTRLRNLTEEMDQKQEAISARPIYDIFYCNYILPYFVPCRKAMVHIEIVGVLPLCVSISSDLVGQIEMWHLIFLYIRKTSKSIIFIEVDRNWKFQLSSSKLVVKGQARDSCAFLRPWSWGNPKLCYNQKISSFETSCSFTHVIRKGGGRRCDEWFSNYLIWYSKQFCIQENMLVLS